jgi:hypothetical protein
VSTKAKTNEKVGDITNKKKLKERRRKDTKVHSKESLYPKKVCGV